MRSILFKAKKPVEVSAHTRTTRTGKVVAVNQYQATRVTADQVATVETPGDIHALADARKIPWDGNTAFLAMTQRVTGKAHLDDLTPDQLKAVARAVQDATVAPGLVTYLRMVDGMQPARPGRAYGGFASFLLKNGRAFKTAPLPKGVTPGHQGLCYMDAFQLADRRPDLTYCEGYVTAVGVPIEHAWCADKDGTIVDPTLGRDTTEKDWAEREYFGVPFDINYVRKTILARKIYGVMHNPEQEFPIIRNGVADRDMRQDLAKAHVKQYERISPTGQVMVVHEHERIDRRGRFLSHQDLLDAVTRQPSSAYPKVVPGAVETQQQYRLPSGMYERERQILHNAIIRREFLGKTPVPHPTVYFMGGGPASGKGRLVTSKVVQAGEQAVMVNQDHIKAQLPEYREGVAAQDARASLVVHEESSDISKEMIRYAGAHSYDCVVDTVGDSGIEKLARKIADLRVNGQRVVGHYATVPVPIALARAELRGRKTGRFVSPAVVRELHAQVSRVWPELIRRGIFDHVTLWNTVADPPTKIAEADGSDLTVHNPPAYQKFLEKGATDDERGDHPSGEGGAARLTAFDPNGGGDGLPVDGAGRDAGVLLEPDLRAADRTLGKAHIKQHERINPSGSVSEVREHDDRRTKKVEPTAEELSAKDGLASMLKDVAKPDGGFTYSPVSDDSPAEGFALSVHKDRERVAPAAKVTAKAIWEYVDENWDLLKEDGNFIGAWHNPSDDQVYLDVSTVVGSRQDAERLGREHGQLAYFDLKAGQSVPIDAKEDDHEASAASGGTAEGRADAGAHLRAGQEADRQGAQPGREGRDPAAVRQKDRLDKAFPLHYRTDFQGLDISIENRKGSTRRGVTPDGTPWATTMAHAYGYIRMTEGTDGDHVDCFVGPNMEARNAYVITVMAAPEFTEVDEQKCMLGFDSEEDAKRALIENYSDPRFFGSILSMPMDEFKRKVLRTKSSPGLIKGMGPIFSDLPWSY